MSMSKKVNLFLVGAPKCGTTSLANFLNIHPEIFLPKIKEPHFFAIKHLAPPISDYVQSISQYNELYDFALNKIKYWLDASVWYYINIEIAKEIYRYNPKAKILLIIRNPLDAVRSLFVHRAMALHEPILDINQAVKLESSRKNGNNIPASLTKTAQALFYVENYKYAEKIENYHQVFGKENVKVLIFDEMLKNKKRFFDEVFGFLQLENRINLELTEKVHNKGLIHRNFTLNKIMKSVPASIKLKIPKDARVYIDDRLSKFFKNSKINNRFDEETKDRLTSEFMPDIIALEKLLNIDLSKWRNSF